ncbi:MAG: DegT/DnrJ/EryC1/StrS family aminotransferase [Candidatus Aenigmatarchaeota archaeon]|nr:MAG: DegT/DnrJ/EryC1/StrS family aminotransferase [Candidatus Aenigmarchaeota archaeon]
MKIPLCTPNIGKEEIKIVGEVLKSGWLADGPKNKQFEKDFAEYIGVKRATSLNSCTTALQLAIQTLNLNGEIILPSFTFAASANSIINSGAKPVFADIDYDTCNIDPSRIEERVTEKTRGIMPVHFAGQPCKMDEIMEIAEKHDLRVIEDSAECLGGEFNKKKTGSFDVGCFSLYPTKNITTGEGGMITTNDEKLGDKIAGLKSHGMMKTTFERVKEEKPWFRAASFAGYNFRLCDVLAAIGLVQLKKVDEMNELRRKHARYLNKRIDFDGIERPLEAEKCRHVYQMYTIKLNNINRDKFVTELRRGGVEASVHFDPPVHLQPYYMKMGCKRGDFPVTEKVSESIVTLPMYPQLKKEQLDRIISSVESVVRVCSKK